MIDRPRYTIGVDFGTESGRAVLVDVADGREVAIEVEPYRNGVIDAHLPAPDEDVVLGPDWALQDPEDYIETFRGAVRRLVDELGRRSAQVIGIGIDFTACTMLPTTRDGTPLCFLDEFRRDPHAWVKLWKHHAAQPEADDINRVARELDQPWLDRYGGKISSEWFFPKALQILREAPDVYRAADRLLEAADWVVWQLTGRETRNNCTAGYKALWSAEEGFPEPRFFEALEPGFGTVVDDKLSRAVVPIGGRAGGLSEQAARWTGLLPGTAVAIANVDAHVSVPAATVTEPGTLVAIMGTSICHVVLADSAPADRRDVRRRRQRRGPRVFRVRGGPGGCRRPVRVVRRRSRAAALSRPGTDVVGSACTRSWPRRRRRLRPGESGLLALDWWNGNRSVLVDADLSGVLVGMTLATTAPEIYRALIESTAFGTRVIIDAFEEGGVAVDQVVACGGLPDRNPLLMQIYADVTGRSWRVAASSQTPALGSAMFAAVAAGPDAGGHATIEDAARAMAHLRAETYEPNPSNRRVYDALYAEYVRLHDLFGRGEDPALEDPEAASPRGHRRLGGRRRRLALADAPGRPAQDQQQAERDEHDRDEVAAERGAGDVDRAEQREEAAEPQLPADPAAGEGADRGDEQEGDPEAERTQAIGLDPGGVEQVRHGEGGDDRAGVERAGAAIDRPLDDERQADRQDEDRSERLELRGRPAGSAAAPRRPAGRSRSTAGRAGGRRRAPTPSDRRGRRRRRAGGRRCSGRVG